MSKSDESRLINKPVGITGGIGSGKSSAARFLKKQFGIEYIDADLVCKDLLAPGAIGWKAFVETFNKEFLDTDQSIDRQKLRNAIFQEPELRQRLDDLMHPLARKEIQNILSHTEPSRCLVEVPLLYEAGWEDDFRAVIVVSAEHKQCMERLMLRDQISPEAATKALAAQLPLSEKANRADHVVNNTGTWENTCLQLVEIGVILWESLSL